jgi:hypothetical protein
MDLETHPRTETPVGPASRPRWTPTRRRLALAAAFAGLALAFIVPALPGTGTLLGGEDVLYFRPPLSELRPPELIAPSNWLVVDAVEVFHPNLEWTVAEVRSGRLPLWNPGVGTGWPELASQQTAPLFPLNLPAYVLPFWDSLGLIAALRIMLAAVGTFLFCRAVLRLRTAPAGLAAVAFAAGAYFISWLEHPHGNVYAMLPWLLLTVDRAVRRPSSSSAGAFGAALGLALLGGHPQSVLIGAFLVAPYAAWRVAPAGRRALGPVSRLPRAALTLAAGSLIGLAASAVMLLPLLEFIGASLTQRRGGLGGIEGSALLTIALPEVWGRPDGGFEGAGPINYFERTIYVGTPALLLAAAGLAVRRDGAQWFFAAMALLGAALAVSLPVVTSIVDSVPPFSLVGMIRALVITSFCLAVLAGYGLQRVLATDARGRTRALAGAGAVATLPLLWLVASHSDALAALRDGLGAVPAVAGEPVSPEGTLIGSILRWLALAAIVLVLLLVLRIRPRVATAFAAAIVALQTADLVELGRGLHPIVDDRVVEAGPTPALQRAMREEGSGRTIGDGTYLLPSLGVRFGLRDPRARGQPTIGRVDALYAGYTLQLPRTFAVDTPRAGDMLDAFAVDQVLTGARTTEPADPELELVTASADDRLYRNVGALPRAYVATSWRRANSETEALVTTVSSSTRDLHEAPVVELRSGRPVVAQPPGGHARFVRDDPDRVILDVRSDVPARLVLLDAHYPGWKATVNGVEVPIAPTNAAFRSVEVPAGRSTVDFRYRPTSVYVGAAASGVAWIALLAIIGWSVARRRATTSGTKAPWPPASATRHHRS